MNRLHLLRLRVEECDPKISCAAQTAHRFAHALGLLAALALAVPAPREN
eukprot:COSAG03_NODE_595_length_6813_cov_18.358505_2_plen_49_part_00